MMFLKLSNCPIIDSLLSATFKSNQQEQAQTEKNKIPNYCIALYFFVYHYEMSESDGGDMPMSREYPDLISEMPRFCCPIIICYLKDVLYNSNLELLVKTVKQTLESAFSKDIAT